MILKTILPVVIALSPAAILALSVMVEPVCTSSVIGVMVSVGSCAATVFVIVVDSLLYLDEPEYTAVMFTSFPARLSGTVYSTVATPSTTFA